MDDPLVPKRLDDAITMVGTCVDMCPRFERYRRERQNNLFNWEVVRICLVFLVGRENLRF
jgi:nuclear mRNA export protein SAC3